MNSDLDTVAFAENPEPRCACLLVLDVSGSMEGERIEALNEGLQVFQDALQKDELASKRVEVGIVTFGGTVETIQEFVTADQFQALRLQAHSTIDGRPPFAKRSVDDGEQKVIAAIYMASSPVATCGLPLAGAGNRLRLYIRPLRGVLTPGPNGIRSAAP